MRSLGGYCGSHSVPARAVAAEVVESPLHLGSESFDVAHVGLCPAFVAHLPAACAQRIERPWTQPGADPTDWFNYGFDEETWKAWCAKQIQMRINACVDQTCRAAGWSVGATVRVGARKEDQRRVCGMSGTCWCCELIPLTHRLLWLHALRCVVCPSFSKMKGKLNVYEGDDSGQQRPQQRVAAAAPRPPMPQAGLLPMQTQAPMQARPAMAAQGRPFAQGGQQISSYDGDDATVQLGGRGAAAGGAQRFQQAPMAMPMQMQMQQGVPSQFAGAARPFPTQPNPHAPPAAGQYGQQPLKREM